MVMNIKYETPRLSEEQAESFWSKVDVPYQPSCCWEWVGARVYGYGRFYVGGRQYSTHRLSYTYLIGRIPDGLCIDHLCRNPACVNPDHLEAVTYSVNSKRGRWPKRSKGAHMVNACYATPELLRAIKKSGWNVRSLAAQVGYSKSHLYNVARGDVPIRRLLAENIATLVQGDFSALFVVSSRKES